MMLQLYRKILAHILGIVILGTSATVNAQPSSAAAHVGVRPPAARAERIPAGRAGHVWAPGYWGWNGRAHVWFGGHWEAERPGFRFIPASWVWVGGEWVFYPGYWDAVAPVVIVQPAPTEYIEQEPVAGPPDLDPNYWYYCRDPAGYYPYVQNCVAWQQVTPVPQ